MWKYLRMLINENSVQWKLLTFLENHKISNRIAKIPRLWIIRRIKWLRRQVSGAQMSFKACGPLVFQCKHLTCQYLIFELWPTTNDMHSYWWCLAVSAENQDINMAPVKQELEEDRKVGSPMIGSGQPLPSNNSWHNCRKLIYVPRSAQKGYSVGHWPIPEAFWPDTTNSTLVSHSVWQKIIKLRFCNIW